MVVQALHFIGNERLKFISRINSQFPYQVIYIPNQADTFSHGLQKLLKKRSRAGIVVRLEQRTGIGTAIHKTVKVHIAENFGQRG